MRKILTTTKSCSDTVESSSLKKWLAVRGLEVVLHYAFEEPPPFDPADVVAIVAGHTPDGEMLHIGPDVALMFPNLKVVSPFGIGTNHLDLERLVNLGYHIVTVPHFSKRTVAELAIGNIFALARRLVPLTNATRSGTWQRQDGASIEGKVLGIIGLGNIGKEVAKLGVAVGMKVVANDIVYDRAFMSAEHVVAASRDEVLRSADFLTLHVPLTDKTEGFINRDAIFSMKQGAFFLNLARGEVIDEAALRDALQQGHLAGAALDVFSQEPPYTSDVLNELLQQDNVIATPHIGAFTPETRFKIAEYICQAVAVALS
jgi:phosphoglycerate dehydrogenase-like enzyme